MPASPPPFADRARMIPGVDARIRASERAAYEQFQRDYCVGKTPDHAVISPAPVSEDRPAPTALASVAAERQMYFEVYRADRINLTSILFSGGDWRWRFCKADGVMVAGSEGFASEAMCRQAVEALQQHAGTASLHERKKRTR